MNNLQTTYCEENYQMHVLIAACLLLCACAVSHTSGLTAGPKSFKPGGSQAAGSTAARPSDLNAPTSIVLLDMGQGDTPLQPPPGSLPGRPIMRCGATDSYDFIRQEYICPDGSQPFKDAPPGAAKWSREGSLYADNYPHIIDRYKVPCPVKSEIVYVDMYACPYQFNRFIRDMKTFSPEPDSVLEKGRQLRAQYSELSHDGSHAKALSLIEQAAEGFKTADRTHSQEYARIMTEMAVSYIHLDNFAVAKDLLENSAAVWRSLGSPDSEYRAETLYFLGEVQAAEQGFNKAAGFYEQSASLFEKLQGPYEPRLTMALMAAAKSYYLTKQPEKSINTVRKVLRITEWVHGSDHRETANVLNRLAQLYETDGRLDAAMPLRRRSQQIMKLWYSQIKVTD